MSNPKEGRDYEIIPDDINYDPQQVLCAIKLLRKPYRDIIVRLGVLKFNPPDNTKFIHATFEFELVSGPSGTNENKLRSDRNFNQLLGDIMMNILDDQLKAQEEYGNSSIRDSDFEIVEED
jgi:hypothetical protein